MTPVELIRHMLTLAVAAVAAAYPPLGWCPPPPGVFVPVPALYQYDYGNVAVGESASITITFRLDPAFASMSPIVIDANPYEFFFPTPNHPFTVDTARSTCAPGALVTVTTPCTLTMTFSPTQIGSQSSPFFTLMGCSSPAPCGPRRNVVANVSFQGYGTAAPVPIGWFTAVISGILLVTSAALRLRRRGAY